MFHMGVLSPAFRKKKEGQNALCTSAVFQVPLTQNNMSKQHIWGWCALNPHRENWELGFNGYRVSLGEDEKV